MQRKASKQCVLDLADKLGYELVVKRGANNIFLIKENECLRRKSYLQAYHYLYQKIRRMNKKKTNLLNGGIYMIKNQNELLQIINIENAKEINYKGNVYPLIRKNLNCRRGNGIYIAYLFRCEKKHHDITLYAANNVIEYAETGYGLI